MGVFVAKIARRPHYWSRIRIVYSNYGLSPLKVIVAEMSFSALLDNNSRCRLLTQTNSSSLRDKGVGFYHRGDRVMYLNTTMYMRHLHKKENIIPRIIKFIFGK